MSVSEHDRRVLHRALVGSLGQREADVLVDLLPTKEWGDFVRRGELEHASSTLRLEMQAMEARLSTAFHRDMVRQTWVLAGTLLAGLGALGGLLR